MPYVPIAHKPVAASDDPTVIDICDVLGREPDAEGNNQGEDWGADINEVLEDVSPASPVQLRFRATSTPGLGYRLSTPIRPGKQLHLTSISNFGAVHVPLYTDWGVSGLILDSTATSPTGLNANGSIIENVGFTAPPVGIRENSHPYLVGNVVRLQKSTGFMYTVTVAGTSAGTVNEALWPTTPGNTFVDGTVTWQCRPMVNGIEMWCLAELRNLYVRNFAGHGIRIFGAIGEIGPEVPLTNANGWRMYNIFSSQNIGFGYYVAGSDGNGGMGVKCDGSFNGQGGIKDYSEIGNTWISPTMEFNGWTVGEVDHASWQGQVDFGSQNGQSVLIGPYIEGGAPCRANGRVAVVGGNIFVPWTPIPPPTYGENIGPAGVIVRNTQISSASLYGGGVWDSDHNTGSTEGSIPTAIGMRKLQGLQEKWALQRGIAGSASMDGLWGFYNRNIDDFHGGFPCTERNVSSRWIVNQLQISGDHLAYRKRVGTAPTMKTDGHRLNRGDVYMLATTDFTPGSPSEHYAKHPTNTPDGGGMAYARWTVNTAYTVGTIVTDSNGNLQRCTTAGTSAAAIEPTWSTTFGNTTADGAGALVWTAGLDIPDFAQSTDYATGALFRPNPRNGYTYRVDLAGNSGVGAFVPSGGFGELQIVNGALGVRRWGYDLAGVRWYPGPNTSGTPL